MSLRRTNPRPRLTARPRLSAQRKVAVGLIAGIVVLAPGALVSPAMAATTPAEPPVETTLKLALTADIDSLNPFKAILASSTSILALQYQNLVAYGAENNEEVPGMAESWTTSEDGTVWTFHLPADREWSDGEPITAQDAEWTFQAIQNNDELKQANGALLTSVETVEATDDETLVMTLAEPQAPNPGTQLPIMPEHVWSQLDDPATFANDSDTVGSGPFTVATYDKTAGVTMKANPNFWQGEAKISTITFAPYKNSDAAVQALKTGELDVVNGLTPAQFQALENEPGITTNAGTGRRYQAIAINPGTEAADGTALGDGNPALRNVDVRRAIAMAIDSGTLLEKVMQGLGEEATGEVPAAYPVYQMSGADLSLAYNPDAANALLDEAGYTMGAGGVRVDENGTPLELRLMGRNTDPIHQQMADYVKPWLKVIGIEVNTVMKASAQVNDDSVLGNYDLYFTGWGMGPDPDFQLSMNQCSSRPNADGTGATSENNFCSADFDALFLEQHAELDQDKRSALVNDAQQMIYDSAVNKVLYYANALEAYRSDRFEPFTTQPADGGVITGQNGPWGYYSATPVGLPSSVSEADSGVNLFAVGVPIALVAIIGTGAFLFIRRRRATADERA